MFGKLVQNGHTKTLHVVKVVTLENTTKMSGSMFIILLTFYQLLQQEYGKVSSKHVAQC